MSRDRRTEGHVSRRSFLTASAAVPIVGGASLPGVLDVPAQAQASTADVAEFFVVESPCTRFDPDHEPWIDCLTGSGSIAREHLEFMHEVRRRHPGGDPLPQLRQLRVEFVEGDCYIVVAQTFKHVWEDRFPEHALDLPETM